MSVRNIHAVFEHTDGYRWEERYQSKKKFLAAVKRLKNATFLHATDFTAGIAIRPSDLWSYRQMP